MDREPVEASRPPRGVAMSARRWLPALWLAALLACAGGDEGRRLANGGADPAEDTALEGAARPDTFPETPPPAAEAEAPARSYPNLPWISRTRDGIAESQGTYASRRWLELEAPDGRRGWVLQEPGALTYGTIYDSGFPPCE